MKLKQRGILMKKFIRIAAVLLAAAMTCSLFGCKKAGKLKENGKLIMATNAEFEPFEYMENGKIVGIDVDIANKIAEDLGLTLEIQNMNFDTVVTAVSSGKADIAIAGLTKTPDREKSVDLTDSYYDASQVIIVKQDNSEITDSNSLKDKKIAVQKGTTGDELASKLTADSNMIRFSASTDAINELKNGKADAVVIDSFPAKVFVKQNTDLKIVGDNLSTEQYCMAVRKGNTELQKDVNAEIKKLKENGTIDEIIKKYS